MKTLKLFAVALIAPMLLTQNSWAMLSEGKVGPATSSDGNVNTLRQGRDAALINQEGHAKYQEQVFRGNTFTCANPAGTAVTTQAGLSATTPALTLYNPVGSGKNLVLITATVDITAAPAAAAGLMLAYNLVTAAAPTATTAGTLTNNNLGNLTLPVGACSRIATLAVAPVAFRYIGGTTGAAAIGGVQLVDKIDGEIIVSPGVAVSFQATSATAIIASLSWEEIPL